MYKDCTTQANVGETEEMEIEVRLHQGSALSPLVFIIIMNVIKEDI